MIDAPALVLEPALMSDGAPFPFRNLWQANAPDGRWLPELTTAQALALAAREGWRVEMVLPDA